MPADELQRVVESMRDAAHEAGVQLVTGDTKVVNRGKGDKVFITTTGLGVIDGPAEISADRARPGDKIMLSGYIGDHGMAIMSQRENLEFEGAIESDCAPLQWSGERHAGGLEHERPCASDSLMRDPTRGGVATTLNEIAGRSRSECCCRRTRFPVRETVQGACEMLGLDPLYVANEGKLIAIVAPGSSRSVC